MLQYVYLSGRKYAVVHWTKMLQYVYVFGRKYAVVYWLKLLQYVMFGIQITPLFTGLRMFALIVCA